MTERTLVNIKPDAVGRRLTGEIIRRIEAAGYRITAMRMLRLSAERAGAFYEEHRGRPYFERLIGLMTSGDCVPMVVEGEGVIRGVRDLIGDTDPAKAKAGTIRRDFGTTVTVNCVHASDGPESASREIAFFFNHENEASGTD
ncbi:MAG: nucleoside-diphosphate kinase [bacterium]|nr:nucleoside-diphosphate kinase [bacterium]